MKKSFMTRVLAASLSAAMAFSMSSATSLMTASAAAPYVSLKTTFKTIKVNKSYKMTLKNNSLNWKIKKVSTTDKKICTVWGKTASYVYLKGKKVGRATITVNLQTSARKTKNTKKLKCRANIVADTPATTAVTATATAPSTTKVEVIFSKAVDEVKPENFTVSNSVKVSEAVLDSTDKTKATLTIVGAEYGKDYTLSFKDVKVSGTVQNIADTQFKTPHVEDLYTYEFKAENNILKSDGGSSTNVSFTVKNSDGSDVTKSVVVKFTSDRGHFAETEVTAEKGVATTQFVSESSTKTVTAHLTATISDSSDPDLIGQSDVTNITLTPNPANYNTTLNAILTNAEADTADRIVAYFSQDVKAADFIDKSTGKPDTRLIETEVKCGLTNNWKEPDGTKRWDRTVVGIVDVEEPNAMALLLDKPLIDNSNVLLKVKNNNVEGSIVKPENEVTFKFTDARKPAVMSVRVDDNKTIVVDYSEAMLATGRIPSDYATSYNWKGDANEYVADDPKKYKLNGVSLDNPIWNVKTDEFKENNSSGSTDSTKPEPDSKKEVDELSSNKKGTISVGTYTKDGDKRNVVTIKLGGRNALRGGNYSLQVANVGDWASATDGQLNAISTQTIDFTVAPNNDEPTATVEVQSPEQYKVSFNAPVAVVDNRQKITTSGEPGARASVFKIKSKRKNASTYGSAISDPKANPGEGDNPIQVTKVTGKDNTGKDIVEGSEYLVETRRDWTQVYNTAATRRNYYNYDYELVIAANTLVNLNNGKTNSSEIICPLTGVMSAPDNTSPTIDDVQQVETHKNYFRVKMSEPVKLSATANTETLTPAERQGLVPVPTASFVNQTSYETIDATVEETSFADAYDMQLYVTPNEPLTAGTWDLTIRSISDDVGNTASSLTRPYTIDAAQTTAKEFNIVWAAAAWDKQYSYDDISHNQIFEDSLGGRPQVEQETAKKGLGRFIFIKFSKPVLWYGGSANPLSTNNYTINGSPLPTGTNIYAHIQGYDDQNQDRGVIESVTIQLPKDFYVSKLNTMITVSPLLKSADDETLGTVNGGEIHLPYQIGSKGIIQGSATVDEDDTWGNAAKESSDITTTDPKVYIDSFVAALNNPKYRKIMLTRNVNLTGNIKTLTINRPVEIDLCGNSIFGNVVIDTTDSANEIKICNSKLDDSSAIVGQNYSSKKEYALTVNAPNVKKVTLEVNVDKANPSEGDDEAIDVKGASQDTFVINRGKVTGDVAITGSAGLATGAKAWISGDLFIASKGTVKLNSGLNIVQGHSVRVNDAVAKLIFGANFEPQVVNENGGLGGVPSTAKLSIDISANANVEVAENVKKDAFVVTVANNVTVKIDNPKALDLEIAEGSTVETTDSITNNTVTYKPDNTEEATPEVQKIANAITASAVKVNVTSQGALLQELVKSSKDYFLKGVDSIDNTVVAKTAIELADGTPKDASIVITFVPSSTSNLTIAKGRVTPTEDAAIGTETEVLARVVVTVPGTDKQAQKEFRFTVKKSQ